MATTGLQTLVSNPSAEPAPNADPQSSTNHLTDDFLMSFVVSTIKSKIPVDEVGEFIDKIRFNLQNGTPGQGPRVRVSSEASSQRPVILDVNNGSGDSSSSQQVSSFPMPRLDQEEIAKIVMLFGNDVVKNGHTNFPDFFEATLIPKIRAAEYFEAWLPGADIAEKQRNFERYMKAARKYFEQSKAYR